MTTIAPEKAQGQMILAEQAGYSLCGAGLSEKMRLLEKFVERKRVEYEELAAELERMESEKCGGFDDA